SARSSRSSIRRGGARRHSRAWSRACSSTRHGGRAASATTPSSSIRLSAGALPSWPRRKRIASATARRPSAKRAPRCARCLERPSGGAVYSQHFTGLPKPKKERAMTDRPDLVIDGDGHVIEVNETYEGIDPKYRERRPVYTQVSRGNIVRLVDGKVWGPDTECGFVGVNGNLPAPHGKAIHYRRVGTTNPGACLAAMDRDQIAVAVTYPPDELPLTVPHDAGFAAARARAYNDWLYAYCEVCPPRLKGIGLVALQDVEGAIEEMHRAVRRLNMVGI